MPRDVSTAIIAEAAKDRLAVIDLLQITFPDPIGTVYWSNYPCTYGGHTYVARVLDIGSWSRSMNPETDRLTITLGNADGYITELVNSVETEQAQLKLIRYFPDIPDVIDPLWVGYGSSIELNEETAEWEIYFGFRGFRHKGLRKLSENCWKVFADRGKGLDQNLGYCPYNILTLSYFRCGRHFTILQDVGIDDDHMHLAQNSGAGTLSDYLKPYDELKASNPPYEEVRVTSVVGDTAYVDRGVNGTEQSSHGTSDYFMFHNCLKSKQDCERRGMYGPPTGVAGQAYNLLRWFGGWAEHIPVSFVGHYRKKLRKKTYTQTTAGNATLMGDVIPAIWGTFRLRGVEAVAAADAKEFRHALFIVAEGECTGIAPNLVRVKGLPPDDCQSKNSDGYNVLTMDSLHVWWGGIGQRQSFAVMAYIQDTTTDTYLNNPYLFNAANGDGPSLSDLFAVRVRVEEGGADFDSDMPDLDIQFTGRKVRTIPSYTSEPNQDPALTTNYPDPIEVAVDYLTNKKFGARLDFSMIDLDAALVASNYCKEIVTSVDPHFSSALSGTVIQGPDDAYVAPGGPRTWIAAAFTATVRDGELSGRTIKITTVGKEQSRTIIYNHVRRIVDPSMNNMDGHYGFYDSQDFGETDPFHMIEVDSEWDVDATPINGDTFDVTGYSSADTVARFRFNGGLLEDDSVESQLAMLLQNCNGYYVAREGKLAIKIKKAENLTEIDALPLLTDYGSDRNILRESGVSTFKHKKVGIGEVINQIDVEFCDVDNSFLATTMHVYDESLQTLLGKVISGNASRVVNPKSLNLVGTTSKDQAMRLGALALREEAMRRDTVTFEMSLKDSLVIEPGDVRKIDINPTGSDVDRKLAKNFPYIRITKITESSKFTASIEAHRHENGSYDDTFTMCVGYPTDAGNENLANLPLNVTPLIPGEVIEYARDGTVLSVVEVEVTYPTD